MPTVMMKLLRLGKLEKPLVLASNKKNYYFIMRDKRTWQ